MTTPEIPNRGNFYSTLDTHLSRKQVAELYARNGWRARKCTWVDYEITCDWADLVIESELPILLHGSVADLLNNVERIVAPLRASGITFKAECYGPSPACELKLELQS
jgi:hypothetical protein